jgi:hypothetical protein
VTDEYIQFKMLLVQAIQECGPDDDDDGAKVKTLERFAELIIEKCGEIADENSERGIISAYIDKYFGVGQ